jgi:hypothetical protein
MIEQSNILIQIQAKPKTEKQITYFCRLCRNYGIKSRKAHLKNYHKADPDTISKRVTDDLVNTIYLPSR